MAINLVKNSDLINHVRDVDSIHFDGEDLWSVSVEQMKGFVFHGGMRFSYTLGFVRYIKEMEAEYKLPFMTELNQSNPRASVCSIMYSINQAKEMFGKEVEAGY